MDECVTKEERHTRRGEENTLDWESGAQRCTTISTVTKKC